jgi:hypothetical protein
MFHIIDSVQLSLLNMQTLELIQRERVSLSARLVEKRLLRAQI